MKTRQAAGRTASRQASYSPKKERPRWKVLYSNRQVQHGIARIARQINHDYHGKTVHVVGIMDNGFIFAADLVRSLKVPVVCHFVRAAVRDGVSHGTVLREVRFAPEVDLRGKHVVLVDAVLRTGVTLDYLCGHILAQKPRSLRAATLIDLADSRKVDLPTDYVGFRPSAKRQYLVGYGLGQGSQYRNLACIATLA